MTFLLNSYSSMRFLINEYKSDIKNTLAEASMNDVTVNMLVWNQNTKTYELSNNIPSFGYYLEENYSYCKNGSKMSYANGNISVALARKDACYAYFKELQKDIDINIYIHENGTLKLTDVVPSYNYTLTSSKCTNGATLTFDTNTRIFQVSTSTKTVCDVEFTKNESDITINIYKEDAYGTHEHNGLNYTFSSQIPGYNYNFNEYVCKNSDIKTSIKEENHELIVDTEGKNECNVYYNGGTDKVEIIIMEETTEGVSGYTTGKKYSRTYGIPGVGYKYVGYKCDYSGASLTYSNGTLEGVSDTQTVCRAYFEKTTGNVLFNYYLETSNGDYEKVSIVPMGYVFNEEQSKCENNSSLTFKDGIPEVSSTTDDVCNLYYDMAFSDIQVNVYVMNKDTLKYELSKAPLGGYEMYDAGCTNGADIEYLNGVFKVQSEGPTVCTVYFR